MTVKELLKPGMIVEMENQDLAIVALVKLQSIKQELAICWGNGSCLAIKDYNDNLIYCERNSNEKDARYNINKIYDLGSFYDPYSMDVSERSIIWKRDGKGFSVAEKSNAALLKSMINSLSSKDSKIFIEKSQEYNSIDVWNEYVSMTIPSEFIFNLQPGESMSLDEIINGEILQ